MLELGIGFAVGFASAIVASWWGFKRGIQTQRPELFAPKSKPPGPVVFSDFDVTGR